MSKMKRMLAVCMAALLWCTPVTTAWAEEPLTEGVSAEAMQAETSVAEKAPEEEVPMEETPAEETPMEEALVEEAPEEGLSMEEIPAEEIPAEETAMEKLPERESLDQVAVYDASDVIASGVDGGITWVIDASGKLTVEGTGDCNKNWLSYASQITSAEIRVSGTTDASWWFYDCANLISVDLSGFDTSSVTSMHGMFWGCSILTSVDLSEFDTSSVTDMSYMFWDCSSLISLDLSMLDNSVVTDMSGMFNGCTSLITLKTPCNVVCSAYLPKKEGNFWYLSDGTIVTVLPRNLAESVTLTRKAGTEPSTPDTPDEPSAPDTPDTPDTPDKPSTPSTPSTPNTPGTPTTPTAPAISPEQPQQEFIVYTVVGGDSLWKIAVRFYGSGSAWRVIYEDNRAVIRNPGRLQKGLQLKIRRSKAAVLPQAPVSPGTEASGSIYTIQAGESLWVIARKAYGNGRLWRLIYDANREIIANPGRIRIGQKIIIPKR